MFKQFIILLIINIFYTNIFAEEDPYAEIDNMNKKEKETAKLILHAKLLITRIDNLIEKYEEDKTRLKNIDFHAYIQAKIDINYLIQRENQRVSRLNCFPSDGNCPELQTHQKKLEELKLQKAKINKILTSIARTSK